MSAGAFAVGSDKPGPIFRHAVRLPARRVALSLQLKCSGARRGRAADEVRSAVM
jgi:hypothetical protein